MRKFVAIFLSASMLAVSSLPTVSLAALCGDTDLLSNLRASQQASHLKAMQAEDTGHDHAHHHHAAKSHSPELHAGHDHGPVAMSGDMQTNRIECGCGCHHNTDGSPLLTTPHLLQSQAMMHEVSVLRIDMPGMIELEALSVPVALPPPEHLS